MTTAANFPNALTANERAAVEAATPLFHAARPAASNRGTYTGKTVDEVLTEHGIEYGYVRGLTTYATIVNLIVDGEDLDNLPHRKAR